MHLQVSLVIAPALPTYSQTLSPHQKVSCSPGLPLKAAPSSSLLFPGAEPGVAAFSSAPGSITYSFLFLLPHSGLRQSGAPLVSSVVTLGVLAGCAPSCFPQQPGILARRGKLGEIWDPEPGRKRTSLLKDSAIYATHTNQVGDRDVDTGLGCSRVKCPLCL